MAVWDDHFSDWDFIVSLFPAGWLAKFKELKVLKFGRKFTGPNKEADLLRVVFMHLACGFSLRTTVAEAKVAGIVDIVDVTLFKHFQKCEEFFAWCIQELLKENRNYEQSMFNDGRHWKAIDGSLIREPGITGSYRRIHYSVNLPQLNADQILITDIKTGEKLDHFNVSPGDVFLADRGFMRIPGIKHVLDHGGDILGRFSPHQKSIFVPGTDTAFALMPKLRHLRHGETTGWEVELKSEEKRIKGRLCVWRNTPSGTQHEEARVREHVRKNRQVPSEKTIELCGYTLIFTSLPSEQYSNEFIMTAYRLRWQIEIVFKRLKSLLELGQLHKYDARSVRAYLNGKMLIALLIEKMIRMGESFFP